MLRVHAANIQGTYLDDGRPIKGKAIVVTSTKEKIAATIVVSVESLTHNDDGTTDITYSASLIYPDVERIGYVLDDIILVGSVESMQAREKRKAKVASRNVVKLPACMANRSVPVLPESNVTKDESDAEFFNRAFGTGSRDGSPG